MKAFKPSAFCIYRLKCFAENVATHRRTESELDVWMMKIMSMFFLFFKATQTFGENIQLVCVKICITPNLL